MAKPSVESIRNVILCGHGSSGKTTMADNFLVLSQAVAGQPSVDTGTSICDFDPEEKQHKYTIEASVVHFDHGGKRFNLIDSPGYPDFIGQTIGAMHAVETALIVVNAQVGIQVNTRRVFDEAGKLGLGRILVINRMDADNINFAHLIESIQEMWGARCVPLNVPVGQGSDFRGVASTLQVPADTAGALLDPAAISDPLVESIIEVDEAVMERYFEGERPSSEELARLIVQAVRSGTLIPIVCCSGKTHVGLREVLDGVAMCGLSPLDLPRTATHNEAEVAVTPTTPGLCARIFKTRIDPFVQKLSFIRVFSGSFKRDDQVHLVGARKAVKISAPLLVQGEKTEATEVAGPGEIVAVAKMEDLHTGMVLGDYHLPGMHFPTPMVALAVTPKSRNDEAKLSGALHKVVEEDPTFHLDRDPQTKELVMTGMSELHLTVVREKLHRRDKLDVDTKQPRIAYRETIQGEAEGSYRHKKQSGGRGQFGEVHIRMFPLPRNTDIDEYAVKARFPSMKEKHYDPKSNFLWIDSIVGGSIPGNFMPAIAKGFAERISGGVLAGYPVQDLCVEVHFGKYHDVDSSEATLKTAARQAFKQVFEKARPGLLEPVVKMNITVPESQVGDIFSDMSSRGGHVSGSDPAGGGFITVHAKVPLREVITYARSLSSISGGLGSYTMEFSYYEVMPHNIQQEVIASANIKEEEEEA